MIHFFLWKSFLWRFSSGNPDRVTKNRLKTFCSQFEKKFENLQNSSSTKSAFLVNPTKTLGNDFFELFCMKIFLWNSRMKFQKPNRKLLAKVAKFFNSKSRIFIEKEDFPKKTPQNVHWYLESPFSNTAEQLSRGWNFLAQVRKGLEKYNLLFDTNIFPRNVPRARRVQF